MSQQDPKTMWEQFLRGDESACSGIYDFYVRDLFRYGVRFCRNEELVKDCIQEVFTSLYRNRRRLPETESVKAYLFACMKHALWRALRRESVYGSMAEMQMTPFAKEPTAEDLFIEGEDRSRQKKRMEQMLALLTPRQQEVVYYRFVLEMSFKEIGKLMSLNYQSAQNLLQRSLKSLRDACAENE